MNDQEPYNPPLYPGQWQQTHWAWPTSSDTATAASERAKAADGETLDDHNHLAGKQDNCDLCILDAIIGEEDPPVSTGWYEVTPPNLKSIDPALYQSQLDALTEATMRRLEKRLLDNLRPSGVKDSFFTVHGTIPVSKEALDDQAPPTE